MGSEAHFEAAGLAFAAALALASAYHLLLDFFITGMLAFLAAASAAARIFSASYAARIFSAAVDARFSSAALASSLAFS